MGLYRRPGSPWWWWSFTIDGHRVRGSTRTRDKSEARHIAETARAQLVRTALTGARPEATLDQALGRYWTEHASRLPSASTIMIYGDHFEAVLGKNMLLSKIDDAAIARYVAKRRAKVSDSTVNRELSIFRAVLRMAARRWKWAVSEIDWQQHRSAEPDHRTRYLTVKEADALIAAAAKHLRPAIVTALFTGLRLGNVMRLDWSHVNMAERLITVRVKSRKPGGKVHSVPIAAPLLVELANLNPKEIGPVFTFKGKPVLKMRTAFASALRRAGIADFKWHDLRHTCASWMIQRGVPLAQVREILGHTDIRLTMRYSHLDPGAARQAVETIGAGLDLGTPRSQAKPRKSAKR